MLEALWPHLANVNTFGQGGDLYAESDGSDEEAGGTE
jgi:hypothetical protein